MIYTYICQGTQNPYNMPKNEVVYSRGATWMPGDQECICIAAWYLTTKALYKHQHTDRAASQT